MWVCDKHRKTTIVDLACAIMFPLTYYYRPDAVTLPVPAKHSSTCQRQGCWRPRPITRARHPGNGHTLKGPNESHNHRYPSDSIRGQGKNQGKEMIGEVRKGVAWDIPLFPPCCVARCPITPFSKLFFDLSGIIGILAIGACRFPRSFTPYLTLETF